MNCRTLNQSYNSAAPPESGFTALAYNDLKFDAINDFTPVTALAAVDRKTLMATHKPLIPAADLVTRNRTRFPNENEEYRQARNALLA